MAMGYGTYGTTVSKPTKKKMKNKPKTTMGKPKKKRM